VAGWFPFLEGLFNSRQTQRAFVGWASKRSISIISIELIRTFRLRKQLVRWPSLFRRVRSERSELLEAGAQTPDAVSLVFKRGSRRGFRFLAITSQPKAFTQKKKAGRLCPACEYSIGCGGQI
jgi:hypothetical protein